MVAVGFDIDDVITKTYEFAVNLMNRELGTHHTLDDCEYPTLEECFGLDKRLVDLWFFRESKNFPLAVEPIPGSREVINKYSHLSQYFITARSESTREKTVDWFSREGYLIDPGNIYFVSRHGKAEEEIACEKVRVAKELGLEFFVEDNRLNANRISEELGIPVCFFQYRFNRGEIGPGVIPVDAADGWKMVDYILSRF